MIAVGGGDAFWCICASVRIIPYVSVMSEPGDDDETDLGIGADALYLVGDGDDDSCGMMWRGRITEGQLLNA